MRSSCRPPLERGPRREPWNGSIFARRLRPEVPRGTLIFAMPFFTSGLRPVIFAISSASGSSPQHSSP